MLAPGLLYHGSSVWSCLIFWNTEGKPKIRPGSVAAFGTTAYLPFDQEKPSAGFSWCVGLGVSMRGSGRVLGNPPVRRAGQVKSGCGQSPGDRGHSF